MFPCAPAFQLPRTKVKMTLKRGLIWYFLRPDTDMDVKCSLFVSCTPLLRWKKCASNWHAVALIFFWRDGQFPVFACVEIFEFDRRFCFLQYVVFGDQILAKKVWRKNHERRLRTCNIYTCLFYIERLLYTRDKVTGFKVETSNPTGFLEKQISSE